MQQSLRQDGRHAARLWWQRLQDLCGALGPSRGLTPPRPAPRAAARGPRRVQLTYHTFHELDPLDKNYAEALGGFFSILWKHRDEETVVSRTLCFDAATVHALLDTVPAASGTRLDIQFVAVPAAEPARR